MIIENSIKGIAAVAVAGFSSGSFPAPAKGIVTKKWEHIWLVYSFLAMAVLPVSMALFSHGVISRILIENPRMSFKVAIFGVLWGLGSLLFGISLVRLGMAITNAMVNGVVVLLGSTGPIIIGAVFVNRRQLIWLIGGLFLLVTSLFLCATASIYRDRAQEMVTADPTFRIPPVRAVLLVVAAGVLSSMLNIGFVVGTPLSEKVRALGCPAFLASVSIWVPILLGGLVFNMGYPVYLISKKHSWSALFCGDETGRYWFRSSLMSVLWFGAILLYGAGASIMGKSGTVYGWALFTAITILTSNMWGVFTGEWNEAGRKPKILMWLSTAVLTASLIILAGQQASG
jgi:L-rhamnose-H+ transport protein